MRFEKLTDCFKESCSMVVTIENKEMVFEKGNDKFEKIIKALDDLTKYSHEMPAFGVSIDKHTREDMNKGTWLELIFNEECSFEGMGFDGLLIKVEKDWHGFNLIRKNNGKYDGRCFYLSLNQNMTELYDVLQEVCNK